MPSRSRASDLILDETARLLEQQFAQPLQIDQIARASGLGASTFYELFRHRFGLTPLQFLTRRRMERAMQLLANPRERIADIAYAVGYDDAYYFSRAFKRYCNVSPAVFRQLVHRRILALGRSCFGHLIALGVPRPNLHLIDTESQSAFQHLEQQAVDRTAIARFAPDLIIGPPTTPVDALRGLAPTLAIEGAEVGWRQQFRAIGQHLGMERIATAWIGRYEQRARLARKSLRQRMGGETVLVMRTGPAGFLVLGQQQRIWGELFFGDLGLGVPTSLQDETALLVADIRELDDFGADRILCLSGWVEAGPRLATTPWQHLQAAKRGAFHLVRERAKPSYSAWFADWLIDRAVSALNRPPLT